MPGEDTDKVKNFISCKRLALQTLLVHSEDTWHVFQTIVLASHMKLRHDLKPLTVKAAKKEK